MNAHFYAFLNMCGGMSRKAYPTGIVTKPGLKNNHLAILRATIEPEHQVITFRNIFFHSLEVSEPGACMQNLTYLLCCGFGSRIPCFFDPWIWDPDPGWKKIRIQIWEPG
jgi:hypothetical protein